MLTPKESAECWEKVNQIFDDTFALGNPAETVKKIIKAIGKDNTLEVFATVAEIKKYDGRISPWNRKALAKVKINPAATCRKR